MPYPTPEWSPAGVIRFLQEQTSENKHFECKAFLNWSFDLNDFHSSTPRTSYFTLRAIESIIAFANADGGLLFLGVAESRAKDNKPDCDGIPITGKDGRVNFIITGIEKDGIGVKNGIFNEDNYRRELEDILFPGKNKPLKKPLTYLTKDDRYRKKKIDYPPEYQRSIIMDIKLIPCPDEKTGDTRTVAVLQVRPSSECIIIHEIVDNYEIPLGYVRLAFNNNGPLKGQELIRWLRDRGQIGKIHHNISAGNILPPPKSKNEQVPAYFQDELLSYTVPKKAHESIPDLILANVKEGHNVFIMGDSGMGKSLLLSYCFLHGEFNQPAVFYSIDRTQGPDRYESAAILGSLRELVQDQTNVRAVEPPIPSTGKAPWVYHKEFFEKVLRTFRTSQPNAKLVIFLDGLDENYQEGQDTEFILNILKSLIVDRSLGIIWVLSSQPRKGMEWLGNHFTIIDLAGLEKEQAEDLLQRQLPANFRLSFPQNFDELLQRAMMESGLYDPEMTILSGRAVAGKLAKIKAISEEALSPLLNELPLNYREKYQWLFNQYLQNEFYTDVLLPQVENVTPIAK